MGVSHFYLCREEGCQETVSEQIAASVDNKSNNEVASGYEVLTTSQG